MKDTLGPEGREALSAWYATEGRELPWRLTRDPYAIWVSEIMCQQTQVAKVIPFWRTWMLRFPTVEACAQASEHDALALWQGLGYYRRCKQLLQGAQFVAAHGWPISAAEWLTVPGVGRYTAAAISSICLGERAAVVDGNVKRIFARLTACELSGTELEAACWEWAQGQIEGAPSTPGDWNQATMELGATRCSPRSPSCGTCPVEKWCLGRAQGIERELPVSGPKQELTDLFHAVHVPLRDGLYGIRPIPMGNWWQGMWSFPGEIGEAPTELEGEWLGSVKYRVTRYAITLSAWLGGEEEGDLTWVTAEDLPLYPMPSPQRKVLELVLERHAQPRLL